MRNTVRGLVLLVAVACLAGCAGMSRGTLFAIGIGVAEDIGNTSIVGMTDEELLEHRQLVASIQEATGAVDAALLRHLVAIDAQLGGGS